MKPVVYGSPGQLAALLVSVVKAVDGEPREVFADEEVKQAGRLLSSTVARRIAEAVSS